MLHKESLKRWTSGLGYARSHMEQAEKALILGEE